MSKEDWKENTIEKIFKRANLWPWKEGEVISVLDVGCGLAFKSKYISAQIRVGVDIYEEYFKHIESEVPYVVVKYDVRKLKDIFIPKSFDLVIALDVVEHVEKEEAVELLKQCESIARKAVIIETPKGFSPQNLDILGHGGHTWQTHRCGFEKEELEQMGYTVLLRDYTMTPTKRHTDLDVELNMQLINAIKFT